MRDVTRLMIIDHDYSSVFSVKKCVCGTEFDYDEKGCSIIVVGERDKPRLSNPCPNCGRRFVGFEEIHIYELENRG